MQSRERIFLRNGAERPARLDGGHRVLRSPLAVGVGIEILAWVYAVVNVLHLNTLQVDGPLRRRTRTQSRRPDCQNRYASKPWSHLNPS
jgi:hypothetical protein